MDKRTLDYLMSKRSEYRDGRDYEDGRRGRRDYAYTHDYEDGRRGRRDMRDYENDYEDRRGRGSVDFEGSMDFKDYGNPHEHLHLTKHDMYRWKRMMQNEDGSKGAHYEMQQILSAVDKMGLRLEDHDFDEKELCMAVNMMYSDYCKVASKYVAPDKELHFFIDLAKAFLDDEDGPGPSAKLALYYNCIVDA